MTNEEVIEILRRIADMLEIKGEDRYRVMAYRRAADNIAHLGRDLSDLWREGRLREVPGIGEALEKKLDELFRTGRLGYYEDLQEEVPVGVASLMAIPEVGPRTAKLLWERLGLMSVAEVEKAAREGKLRELPGLGARSEQRILEGIEALYRRSTRIPLYVAWPVAQDLVAYLRSLPMVERADAAGSLRRMKETVGDIDLLASSVEPAAVTDAFVKFRRVKEIAAQGPAKATVRLDNGLQVDLMVLEPARFGSLLQHFTGSKAHNIALRERAIKQGLSLSEHGFKRQDGSEILCPSEEEVYQTLGLQWIPPELREDRGEIEMAAAGRLPKLVELGDIRGDLHVHTRWSDGAATIEEVASKARALGYEYLVISDHTKGLGVANGLDEVRLREQRREIDRLNDTFDNFRLLQGAEVEIRGDGSLDFPDEVLAELDVVVASIHSGLRQDRETITARMIKAMRNPHVDIIGHPSGRILGQREASLVDLDDVLIEAQKTGTILEIDGIPDRLDLDDVHVRRAVEMGVRLSIDSDAHSLDGLEAMYYGVMTARRGWAEKKHIVNTLPLAELLASLKQP
ncbi:MAG: DNA polymerase/3'-5' exonuclease PolX [Chloroflexi bacterium]|nr:DNA polymerase/3'-5' exonuclease PolX [Chloroflexota bacterium]